MGTWLRYNAVSAMGFGVQLASLTLLIDGAHWHTAWATAAAVELSVLHNFAWHWRWTFSGRSVSLAPALLRYHLITGVVSVAGNTVSTSLIESVIGLAPVWANAAATIVCYAFNWWSADSIAFRSRTRGSTSGRTIRPERPENGVPRRAGHSEHSPP